MAIKASCIAASRTVAITSQTASAPRAPASGRTDRTAGTACLAAGAAGYRVGEAVGEDGAEWGIGAAIVGALALNASSIGTAALVAVCGVMMMPAARRWNSATKSAQLGYR